MRTLTLAATVLFTLPLLAQKPGDPSPEPPPEKPAGPVTARLVAKKGTTFILDRQGMTADKYAEAVKAGKITPPEVHLVLELKNTTKEDVEVRIGGVAPKLKLDLTGKGKVVEQSGKRSERVPLTYVKLTPGQVHELPLKTLTAYSSATQETHLYWTEPGEYVLTADFSTYVRTTALGGPVVKGAVPLPAGGVAVAGRLTKIDGIKAERLKLTVTLK